MRYTTYRLVRASGKVEKMRCPSFFSPADIAARLPHTEVFFFVPAKYSVFVDQEYLGGHTLTGPAWAYINTDGEVFAMPDVPESDGHAYRMITEHARYREAA